MTANGIIEIIKFLGENLGMTQKAALWISPLRRAADNQLKFNNNL